MHSTGRFFKHDAFITYAHRDNVDGGITSFHAQFVEYLQLSLDWEPSIWLDSTVLLPQLDWEEQIREGLRDSAILVVVLSDIVDSRRWCRDERKWFMYEHESIVQRTNVKNVLPIWMQAADLLQFKTWLDMLTITDPILRIDPCRNELMNHRDLTAHADYWRDLDSWFAHAANAIVRAHSAYQSVWNEAEPL